MKTFTSVVFVTGLMFSSVAAATTPAPSDVTQQLTQLIKAQVSELVAQQAAELKASIQQDIDATFSFSTSGLLPEVHTEDTLVSAVTPTQPLTAVAAQPQALME